MTLKYLYGQDELVAGFVAAMIPWISARGFGPACKALGVVKEIDGRNELIAGLVFHTISEEAALIEISGAALPGFYWATRETLKLMHQIPFMQYGCQMVVMKTPVDNVGLIEQLSRLGYELILMPRIFGRDRDGMYCYLTYEAWMESFLCRRYKHHVIHSKQNIEKDAA